MPSPPLTSSQELCIAFLSTLHCNSPNRICGLLVAGPWEDLWLFLSVHRSFVLPSETSFPHESFTPNQPTESLFSEFRSQLHAQTLKEDPFMSWCTVTITSPVATAVWISMCEADTHLLLLLSIFIEIQLIYFICVSFTCTEKWFSYHFSSVQFSSVSQSCLTLCNPVKHSTPGLPVHHQLPELTQTHVHQVSDAIQPSHPLSSPSPPARNPSQHQSLFQRVKSSHEVAKVLERNFVDLALWTSGPQPPCPPLPFTWMSVKSWRL